MSITIHGANRPWNVTLTKTALDITCPSSTVGSNEKKSDVHSDGDGEPQCEPTMMDGKPGKSHPWGPVQLSVHCADSADSSTSFELAKATNTALESLGVPKRVNPFGPLHPTMRVKAIRMTRCDCGRLAKWKCRVLDPWGSEATDLPDCYQKNHDRTKGECDSVSDDAGNGSDLTSGEEAEIASRMHLTGSHVDVYLDGRDMEK